MVLSRCAAGGALLAALAGPGRHAQAQLSLLALGRRSCRTGLRLGEERADRLAAGMGCRGSNIAGLAAAASAGGAKGAAAAMGSGAAPEEWTRRRCKGHGDGAAADSRQGRSLSPEQQAVMQRP